MSETQSTMLGTFDSKRVAKQTPAPKPKRTKIPMARSSDPVTSHESAESIDLKATKAALLDGFDFYGTKGATAREAAAAGAERHMDMESVRKRYTNLLAEGKIEARGKRKCLISGKTATVYFLVTEKN